MERIIAGATLSVTSHGRNDEGRTLYRWRAILPDGQTFKGSDIKSGCQGGSTLEGLASFLGFLSAAAEAGEGECGDPDSNASLFPAPLVAWAEANSDDLSMEASDLDYAMETVSLRESVARAKACGSATLPHWEKHLAEHLAERAE